MRACPSIGSAPSCEVNKLVTVLSHYEIIDIQTPGTGLEASGMPQYSVETLRVS